MILKVIAAKAYSEYMKDLFCGILKVTVKNDFKKSYTAPRMRKMTV